MLRFASLFTVLAVAASALTDEPKTLSVEQAVERGRSAQPALRFAQDNLKAAHERIGEAVSGYLPQLALVPSYQLGTSNFVINPGLSKVLGGGNLNGATACLAPGGTVAPCISAPRGGENMTPYSFFSAQLNASETIWDFGRTSNAVGQADAAEQGAAKDLLTARHQVDLNVRTAFFTALADQQLVDVAKVQLEDMKKHLQLAQGRFEVGAGARYDVSLAQANEQNAEVALITAENNFNVAKATLNQSMGTPGDLDYRLVPTPLELSAPIPEVEPGTEEALKARPDYQSATQKIEAQERTVDAERANFYPILAAAGNFGYTGYTTPLVYNWQVGATLTVPILSGGIDIHKLHEYQATLDSLVASRDTIALQVRLDVESAVLTARQTKASLSSAEAAVKSGEDALALAEGRYQTGVGTIVDLNDAQVTEVTAKVGLIQADYNYEAALAKLRYALGED